MKVVLDTNVLVSGLFFGGHPEKIIKSWGENAFNLCVTEEILKEYFIVLKRFANADFANEWLELIAEKSALHKVTQKVTICRDQFDNKFLECALSSKAKYIVSGDKDLLVLKNFKQTQIITAKDFFNKLS